MKQSIFLPLLVTSCLTACHFFPPHNNVKEGHFRVANLTDSQANSKIAHVYTMCHKQRPVSWASSREYPSGKQTLWVKATIQQIGMVQSYREAHVNFTMDFPEGGDFQLAHKIEQDTISIWLQDSNSLTPKSNVVTTKLKSSSMLNSKLGTDHCNKVAI